MSWHYLPGLVEESSAPTSSDGGASAPWKKSRTSERCCSEGSGTACYPCSQSGTTSTPSTEDPGVASWMFSLLASHVSPFPSPAHGEDTKTTATSGPKPSGSFAKWDHATASWRTYQISLLTGTTEPYSENWPRAGIVSNGIVFQQQPLAPLTDVIASGLLGPNSEGRWPTPVADGDRTKDYDQGGMSLGRAARSWPTPHGFGNGHGSELSMGVRVVEGLSDSERTCDRIGWPTPRACDGDHPPMGPRGRELEQAVKQWPTPAAADGVGDGDASIDGYGGRQGGPNLRTAVKWRTPDAYQRGGAGVAQERRDAGHCVNLADQVREEEEKKYPSPAARDHRSGKGRQDNDHTPQLPEVLGGQLNPYWVEWLMAWPIGWTALEPLDPEHFAYWEQAEDWWACDPADDPKSGVTRVAKGIPNRIDRLTGIGNGQVPPVVVAAWRLLS